LEPFDAGIMVIDLAARVVAVESTYSLPLAEGEIHYHDGEQLTDFKIPYRVADDWLFVFSIEAYKGLNLNRRENREKRVPLDERAILYGLEMLRFLAEKILAAQNPDDENLFTEIHAEWLMTGRASLGGKSPREVMFEEHEFVEWEMNNRCLQWSFTDVCPPPLPAGSEAFARAGFGTHEIVVYYDLIRFLLGECLRRKAEEESFAIEDEVLRLERLKTAWLDGPNYDFFRKTPLEIIELERRRIPLTVSGKEAMVNEDCPLCQMMAEDAETPVFWHLDGSAMEFDRFEFSFCATREEWEEEQRPYEEFNREFAVGKWDKDDPDDKFFESTEEIF
jgi:hypothetical protein